MHAQLCLKFSSQLLSLAVFVEFWCTKPSLCDPGLDCSAGGGERGQETPEKGTCPRQFHSVSKQSDYEWKPVSQSVIRVQLGQDEGALLRKLQRVLPSTFCLHPLLLPEHNEFFFLIFRKTLPTQDWWFSVEKVLCVCFFFFFFEIFGKVWTNADLFGRSSGF